MELPRDGVQLWVVVKMIINLYVTYKGGQEISK